MRAAKIAKNQEGFSIIEIVVSLFMVGVVLIVYAAAVNTLSLNRFAKDQEIALRVAGNKLETLRAGGYAGIPASGSFSDPLLNNLPHGASANLTVSDYNDKTKQIVATVNWAEPGRPQATVSLTTLITEGGLGQ